MFQSATYQSILLALHILAVVVWVGGMFFAFFALRPAATKILEPPKRLTLWSETFRNFFPWVWLSIILILISGFSMMGIYSKPPLYILIMFGTGILMMLIFMLVYFVPYKRLKLAVKHDEWPEGGKQIGKIRILIGVNLVLGIVTIFIATAGKLIFF